MLTKEKQIDRELNKLEDIVNLQRPSTLDLFTIRFHTGCGLLLCEKLYNKSGSIDGLLNYILSYIRKHIKSKI